MDLIRHFLDLPCKRRARHKWFPPLPGEQQGCQASYYSRSRCRLPRRCHP